MVSKDNYNFSVLLRTQGMISLKYKFKVSANLIRKIARLCKIKFIHVQIVDSSHTYAHLIYIS